MCGITRKETVWDTSGGFVVLETAIKYIKCLGYMINPYNQCEAKKLINIKEVSSNLACRQSKDIAFGQGCGRKHFKIP